MYKHILAAVDGSDTSNLALAEAVRLAKEQQGAIRLIHVIDETPPYSLSGGEPFPITEYENLMREAGAKLMADVAAKFAKPASLSTLSVRRSTCLPAASAT